MEKVQNARTVPKGTTLDKENVTETYHIVMNIQTVGTAPNVKKTMRR